MNKLISILAFLFLISCNEVVQDDHINHHQNDSDPKHYVDLYYLNYDSLKSDPVKVNSVFIENDTIVISLSYGGGCKEHIIDLARIHPSCGTPLLPPPTFEIRHDANQDACEAWITETVKFDISRLQDEHESPVQIILQAKEYGDDYFHKELEYTYE